MHQIMEMGSMNKSFAGSIVMSLIICFSTNSFAGISSQSSQSRWNILFIAVDDLNDWTTLFGGPIKTPHLERLARRGIFFNHAYCPSPACNPSRVAILTGLRTSTTGVYGNKTDWRRAIPDAVTIPQHFMKNGYWAEGAGKIFHHHYNSAFHDDASFHRFFKLRPDPYPERHLNGIATWVRGRDSDPVSPAFDWGPWPDEESRTPDVQTVNYAINFLKEKHNRPFFFAAGIFRPHSPWFAPEKDFRLYSMNNLSMPDVPENDLDDLPSGGIQILKKGKPFIYETIIAHDQLKEAIQAYQACATFADRQIGRLLDALDESPYKDNTIIVLWSDHGFHLGEKKHWEKFVLWEKSTRTPFIIAGPGLNERGAVCESPVSLLDIYPTLIELCGLENRPETEGNSLVPLLKDPDAVWDTPAIITYGKGNHAVRSRRWRYIRYSDGSEELYDHYVDPNEWYNLAAQPEFRKTIEELKKWLPDKEAEPVPDMEAWRSGLNY
jgi:arylsulfatase A-like enzyme